MSRLLGLKGVRLLDGLERLQVEDVGVLVRLAILLEPLKLLMGLFIRRKQIRQAIHVGLRELYRPLLDFDHVQLLFKLFELTLRFLLLQS